MPKEATEDSEKENKERIPLKRVAKTHRKASPSGLYDKLRQRDRRLCFSLSELFT